MPGIITSISTRSMSGTSSSLASASKPLRPISTCRPFCSSALVSAKMLRTSSSTSSTLRPSNTFSRLRAVLQHGLALGRQLRFDLVQEQRDLVEQPLGRARALDDDGARVLVAAALLPRASGCARYRRSPAGTSRCPRSAMRSSSSLPCMSGSFRSMIMQSKIVSLQQLQRLFAGGDGGDVDVVVVISCTTLSRWRASSSTSSTRLTFLRALVLQALEDVLQLLARGRLDRVADGAHVQRGLARSLRRHDVHGDVARARVVLQVLQHARPEPSGRRRPAGWRWAGCWWRAPAPRRRWRDQAAIAHLVRQVVEHAGEGPSSSTTSSTRPRGPLCAVVGEVRTARAVALRGRGARGRGNGRARARGPTARAGAAGRAARGAAAPAGGRSARPSNWPAASA